MLVAFIQRAVVQGIPLLFGSTGEILTEKSGNLNLGTAGVMYVGGITGVIGAFLYEQNATQMNTFLTVLIPILSSILGSLVMGLIYSFLTVTLRANQNVTGLALTTFGVGFGKSRQKYLYLPEPQNDFVFSVICEELGFFPTLLIVIIPFILLLARGFTIALRARSRYAKLLALGISVQVALQAGLNIAVVTSTVPNTGISLPFFSYGGSSLVTLLIEMGMVLAVSRNDERKRTNAQR